MRHTLGKITLLKKQMQEKKDRRRLAALGEERDGDQEKMSISSPERSTSWSSESAGSSPVTKVVTLYNFCAHAYS